MKKFAFTMDLEADYAGVVDKYGIFQNPDAIENLLEELCSTGIKITVFSVGEIFESFPKVIKLFEKYNCEFEPHSYSHNFNYPDSEDEIEKSKAIYYNFFNKQPIGYRAPRGKITADGIKMLEKHGFLYDSSIFPSYFPNPFKYLLSKKDLHYHENSKILEIPFTSLSPLRITLSISYIKLLGINLFKRLTLPNTVCFGSHLHDFIINDDSFNRLPLIWKLIYNRNKFNGTDLCIQFLDHVKQLDYQFCYMSDIYNSFSR